MGVVQYTDIGKTWHKVSLITGHARRGSDFQFTSLAHLLDVEYLRDCYENLNRNKAVGIDNVSWEDYGKNPNENPGKLVSRLKRKNHKPIPARRVYFPKNETEKRSVGISALGNKIIERGITWILESIYKQNFLKSSCRFRPNRNTYQTVKEVNDLVLYQTVNHIVEADIKVFFNTVLHERLIEFIRIRIGNTILLNLIEKFLKAGYVGDGILSKPDARTPQGSILSPRLANIFLSHVLDTWFETTIKSLVERFCEIRGNARTQNRRANTSGFLGGTHDCGISKRGYFKVPRKASRKKYTAKCKELNKWLKKIRNIVKTKDWWKILIAKLRGHLQYHGMSGNYNGIVRFSNYAVKMVHKWINRRSQKREINWGRFNNWLEHYHLPKPKIIYGFYMSSVR